jgi:hypothetical protein
MQVFIPKQISVHFSKEVLDRKIINAFELNTVTYPDLNTIPAEAYQQIADKYYENCMDAADLLDYQRDEMWEEFNQWIVELLMPDTSGEG